MVDYKVNFQSMKWENPFQGVKDKVVQHEGNKLRLVEYSKEMPLHWCERGHVGMILEGEMEIEFDNGKKLYKAGDGVFIPDGESHRHRGKTLTDLVIAIFVESV